MVPSKEHPHPIGIKPEQCAEPRVSLMRLQIVPSGRDGAEEYGDFSAFSPWPTKRQPSFLPIRSATFPTFEETERDGPLMLYRGSRPRPTTMHTVIEVNNGKNYH